MSKQNKTFRRRVRVCVLAIAIFLVAAMLAAKFAGMEWAALILLLGVSLFNIMFTTGIGRMVLELNNNAIALKDRVALLEEELEAVE